MCVAFTSVLLLSYASRTSSSSKSLSMRYGRANCLRYPFNSRLKASLVSRPSSRASRTFNLKLMNNSMYSSSEAWVTTVSRLFFLKMLSKSSRLTFSFSTVNTVPVPGWAITFNVENVSTRAAIQLKIRNILKVI